MGDGRASLDLDLEDGLHPHEEEEGEDEVVDNAIPRREGTQPQLYRSCSSCERAFTAQSKELCSALSFNEGVHISARALRAKNLILAKSLAYPSGEDGGNFLVQMIFLSSVLYTYRRGGRGSSVIYSWLVFCQPQQPREKATKDEDISVGVSVFYPHSLKKTCLHL